MVVKPSRMFGIILITLTLASCASPEEKAANYIANAEILLAEGQLDKAEIEFRNALQINQNQPDAIYGLAKIYEHKKDWSKAYALVSQIRELAPGHIDGRIMLARFLLASDQLDQALSDAKDIMQLAPGDARAHSLMAALQVRLGNHEDALLEAGRALLIEPGNSDAFMVQAKVFYNEKNFDAARKALERGIAANPEDASLYLMQLQTYEAMADRKAVEGVLLTLIQRFPDEIGYRTALARHYIIDNNVDGAEGVLVQIVNSNPGSVVDKLRLVTFKYQYRSIDAALALANKYIASSPGEFPYRFLLGELYERDKQLAKAVNVYQEIMVDDGLKANGLEARNKIASIEIHGGNAVKASALVDEVLTQDAANKNGLLLRAEMQVAQRRFDDALVNARIVLRDSPDSLRAMELLGQIYAAMGSRDLARESYKKVFQLYPGSTEIANQLAKVYILEGKNSQADEVLTDSIARGNRSLDAIQMLARVKLALGQWDQAELLLKELQKVKGMEALSQQALGYLYQGKNDEQASIAAFESAHELAPTSVQPIAAVVQGYMRSGKVDAARDFLESVISVDADNLSANLLLARMSLYENDIPGAIERYSKLIRLNSGAYPAYHDLARIHIGQNNIDEAERVTRRGLDALPDLPLLLIDLASIQEMKGEIGKAIETYESLLNKNPNLIVAKNNLASLLAESGEGPAALGRALDIAAELKSSEIPQFRDTYAWASVKAETNLDEAIVILEAIVRDNPQVDVYSYHLGEAYRKRGNPGPAMAFLQKAIDLASPGSQVARQADQSMQQLQQ